MSAFLFLKIPAEEKVVELNFISYLSFVWFYLSQVRWIPHFIHDFLDF